MQALDIEGNFPLLTTAATAILRHLGPDFTGTPIGHIQTDIAAGGSRAGLTILQEVVLDLADRQPATVLLSEVHSLQEEVKRFMSNFAGSNGLDPVSGWADRVPSEHEPLLECEEMTRRLAPNFYEAAVTLDRPYYKILGALVAMRLVLAGHRMGLLDPRIGKAIAFYHVVAGSKTIPHKEALWPAPPSTHPS